MKEIDSCVYNRSGFTYITNHLWKHAPRFTFSRSNLIFVTEGILYIEEKGVKYEVKPGECLLLEMGYTSVGYKPSGVNTGFYWLLFDTETLPPIPKHFKLYDSKNVHVLFKQLVSHLGYTDYPPYAMNCLMKAIFSEVVYQSVPHEIKESSLSESIKKYITRDTLWRNISVNEIATHFGFCPDYISRVFYQSEHVQLKKYLDNIKVQKIQEYLSSTNHSVKTISEVMSFHSASSFCKFFKYHTGMTPNEYRKKFYIKKDK